MSRIVPLGLNGYFPSHGRQTMSFLLLAADGAFLLDAGTGASRLFEPRLGALLEPYGELHVVLSHYHLDHVAGLAYLPAVWGRRVRVYAPAAPLVDAEPEAVLDRLLAPPLFPSSWRSFGLAVEALREERARIGGLEARLWRQPHPGGSAGIRLGDEIAYLTDTSSGPDAAPRVSGVRLLLHELWATGEEAGDAAGKGHSHFGAVAELVRRAGVPAVMLIHHHPGRSDEEIAGLVARMERETGARVLAAAEGEVCEF
ncbi:MAG TPA: MBL fold metallo-hydrolase [Bryobacteraceae bacterium]|nr:MBL fold metallo-hydrolase [Bryobacteraceae bacterium]